jgi:hypothetical protein
MSLRLQNIEIESDLLAKLIADERAAGVEHFDSKAAVADPFETPFFRAVMREGFIPVKHRGGCVEFSTCSRCRSYSAGLYTRGEEKVWLCPACDRH